jgi:hypothetical protein
MATMPDSEVCPVCGGPQIDSMAIQVCGGCAHSVAESGAISVTSTAEFTAVTPDQAASILDPQRKRARTDPGVACTWCSKPQDDVKKLLSGGGVNICNECVALCADILLAELGEDWR